MILRALDQVVLVINLNVSVKHTSSMIKRVSSPWRMLGQIQTAHSFSLPHGPTPHLDGKHTVFGEVTEGQGIVDSIAQGDTIDSIEIKDSTDALFAAQADRIADWKAAQ